MSATSVEPHLFRISISFALAQSTKLSVLEVRGADQEQAGHRMGEQCVVFGQLPSTMLGAVARFATV
jgi:hypothetical protein